MFDSGLLLMLIKALLTTENIASDNSKELLTDCTLPNTPQFPVTIPSPLFVGALRAMPASSSLCLACDQVELLELSLSVSLFVGGAGGYAS